MTEPPHQHVRRARRGEAADAAREVQPDRGRGGGIVERGGHAVERRVPEAHERVARVRSRVTRHEQLEQRIEEDGARIGGDRLRDLRAETGIRVPAELAREPPGEPRRQVAQRAREDRTRVERHVRQRLVERCGRRALVLDEAARDEPEEGSAPYGRRARIAEVAAEQRFVRHVRDVEAERGGAHLAVVVLEKVVDEAHDFRPRRVREERERTERYGARRMEDEERRHEVALAVRVEHVDGRDDLRVVGGGERAEQHLERADVERRQRALDAGAEDAELLAEPSDVVVPERR